VHQALFILGRDYTGGPAESISRVLTGDFLQVAEL